MKHWVKRIFAGLMCLTMLISTVAFAAETNPDLQATGMASIGSQSYGSFKAALDHVKSGQTIVLLQDSDCRNQDLCVETWQQNITLDLNSHDLIVTQLIVKGTLTVKDRTVKTPQPNISNPGCHVGYTSGKLTDRPNEDGIGYLTVAINDGGTLTLDSGTIESTFNCAIHVEGERMSSMAGPNEAKLIVNGGYIKAPGYAVGVNGIGAQVEVHGGAIESTNYAAISGSGDDRDGSYSGGTAISVDGGTIIGRVSAEDRAKGYHACGIFHPQNGTVAISGGLVYAENGVGVQMSGGSLNMTGGTVMTTGSFAGQRCDATAKQPIPLENCYGVQVDQKYGYYDRNNVQVAISGNAVVVTEQGTPALDVNTDENDKTPNRLVVTGGTFSNDVSQFLPDDVSGQTNEDGQFEVGKPQKPNVPPVDPETQAEEQSITAGVSALHSPARVSTDQGVYSQPASYVYLGTVKDRPIRWRVLDAQKDSTGLAGLFVLTNGLYGETELGGVRFDSTAPYSAQWTDSEAQAWCRAFLTQHFSAAEQLAIRKTSKTEPETQAFTYTWAENQLVDEQLFFLSMQELTEYVASYGKAPGMAAIRADGASGGTGWWLRTPLKNKFFIASGVLTDSGKPEYSHVNGTQYAARPACNLDENKILFTSAAKGGKTGVLGQLKPVEKYTGQDWKLTLLDKSRADFKAALSGTVLTYSGAKTGENEYISAVLLNEKNEIVRYGRLAQVQTASGTIELNTSVLSQDGLTLKFFNEQYNGGEQDNNGIPDLASPMILGNDNTEPEDPDVKPEDPDQPQPGALLQMMAGTAALTAPETTETGHLPTSYIWYGTHSFTDKGVEYENPLLWRVLDSKLNIAGNPGLLLLTEKTLGVGFNGDVIFGKGYVSDWNGSLAQQWCRDFAENSLTAGERAAVQTVSKDEADAQLYDKNWKSQKLTDEQVFFLSAPEAAQYLSARQKDDSLKTLREAPGRSSSYWWLRSPESGDWAMGNACVNKDGTVSSTAPTEKRCARPAVDLDPNLILFTSAAKAGKAQAIGALKPLQAYEGNEWKLTLLDKSRADFKAALSGTVLTYSGAKTGENEYISAVLMDDTTGAVTHYGKLAQVTAEEGQISAELSMPAEGTTLYFFNEQDNGDCKTDYSSALVACVPIHEHSGILVPGTPASCEADGTRSYYICFCGAAFEDADCTREILDLTRWIVIPALGHDWGAVTYQWSQDGSSCTARRVCMRDSSHVQTAVAAVTSEQTKRPTSQFRGETTYTAVFDAEWAEKQTKTLADIPAAGVDHTHWVPSYPKPQVTVNFRDVPTDAFYSKPVAWAVRKGITTGAAEGVFDPMSPCIRSQIVTFLWRAAGSPAPAGAGTVFTDVPDGAFYFNAVLWAVGHRVTTGMTADSFGPEVPCTRAQAVTFLWRAAGSPTPRGNGMAFSDISADSYYHDAVLWAVENGITNGTGSNTFAPDAVCTRAEIVTFLYRNTMR